MIPRSAAGTIGTAIYLLDRAINGTNFLELGIPSDALSW
jgi:hypothetical protein